MPVSAYDVAAVLRDRVSHVPVKKLHKLLYYCQGHHMAAFNEPLFTESLSAWDMGPVVGQLWYAERQRLAPETVRPLTEAQLNTVGYVLSRYGALTGMDLERLTHNEPPWQQANCRRHPGESARIDGDLLRQYFLTSGAGDDLSEDEVRLDADVVHDWLSGAEMRKQTHGEPDDMERLRARLTDSAPA
jgi:uncharacterized phage-associated protein